MNKTQKTESLNEINSLFSTSKLVVLAEMKGVNVADISQLRRDVRNAHGVMKVAKNTLVRRVVGKDANVQFHGLLRGQNAVTFCKGDPIAVVKKLVDFAKQNGKFKVKAAIFEGAHVDTSGLQALAKLPSREVLLAQLMGMLNAPVGGLMGVLDQNIQAFLYLLKGIEEKKAQEGNPSAS